MQYRAAPLNHRPSSPLPTNNLFLFWGIIMPRRFLLWRRTSRNDYRTVTYRTACIPAPQPPDHRTTNLSPAVNSGADHIDAGCGPDTFIALVQNRWRVDAYLWVIWSACCIAKGRAVLWLHPVSASFIWWWVGIAVADKRMERGNDWLIKKIIMQVLFFTF